MALDRDTARGDALALLVTIREARERARGLGDAAHEDIGIAPEKVCKALLALLDEPTGGTVFVTHNVTINHTVSGPEGIDGAELRGMLEAHFKRALEPAPEATPKGVQTVIPGSIPEGPPDAADAARKRAEEDAKAIDTWEPTAENLSALPWTSEWILSVLTAFREEHKGETAKRPATMLRGFLNKHPEGEQHKRAI